MRALFLDGGASGKVSEGAESAMPTVAGQRQHPQMGWWML
jgi:hypothetical protein